MRNIIKLTLFILLTSCGILMINENDYRALNSTEKNLIKPFDLAILSQKINNNDELNIYEINSNDIKNCTKIKEFTWVHLWRPFCPAESCQNIENYLEIENEFKTKNLELILISESYDFNSIKNCVNNSFFDKPIFVLQDSYYGHKIRKNRLKLYNDLNTLTQPKTKIGFDDYFFKDTVLIYAGDKLDKYKIDSLIKQQP